MDWWSIPDGAPKSTVGTCRTPVAPTLSLSDLRAKRSQSAPYPDYASRPRSRRLATRFQCRARPPWFYIVDRPVYHPPAVFWWCSLRRSRPRHFHRGRLYRRLWRDGLGRRRNVSLANPRGQAYHDLCSAHRSETGHVRQVALLHAASLARPRTNLPGATTETVPS